MGRHLSFLLIVTGLALTGCSSGSDDRSLTATVDVAGDDDWLASALLAVHEPGDAPVGPRLAEGEHFPCGSSPSPTVASGTQVVVRDGESKTVATGELPEGTIFLNSDDTFGCTFTVALKVPGDLDFYEIELEAAGTETFSQEELDDANWNVALDAG